MSTYSKTRIIFFIPTLGGGGAEKAILDICFGLQNVGFDIMLVVGNNSYQDYFKSQYSSIKIIDLKVKRLSHAFFPLRQIIMESRPNLVFSFIDYANVLCSLIKISIISKKIIFVGSERNAILPATKLLKSFETKKLLLFVLKVFSYKLLNRITCVSDGVRWDVIRKIGVAEYKVKTLVNPILYKKTVIKTNKRKKYLSADQPLKILSVGRLSKQKDFALLIKACGKASAEKRIHLTILGKGELKTELLKLIDLKSFNNLVVDFPGFVKDVGLYMQNCDLFILSSLWEGLPNVLVQAINCNCRVISSWCEHGPPEILKEQNRDICFTPGKENELSDLIKCFIKNPSFFDRKIDLNIFYQEAAIVAYEKFIRELV